MVNLIGLGGMMNIAFSSKFRLLAIGLAALGLVGCGGGGAAAESGTVTGVTIPAKVSVVNAN